MDDLIAAEAQGDANNLKGTDYHLLYAVWLLVKGGVKEVQFYAGNDLLSLPQPPPPPEGSLDQLISAAAALGDEDVWIQLKHTSTPWSCSTLLEENLLDNFVTNSFLSESRNRAWQTKLVTTGKIDRRGILKFTTSPGSKPKLRQKLHRIVTRVSDKLTKAWGKSAPPTDLVLHRALTVLTSVADNTPVAREVLDAEINAELAFCIPDRTLVSHVKNTLIGALLEDAGTRTVKTTGYGRDWLRACVGHDLSSSLPFDKGASYGCDAQVEMRLPKDFNLAHFISRCPVERLLQEFLETPATVFVLGGRSGTGKSWFLANTFHTTLRHKARLVVPGNALTEGTSLPQLIAGELRPLTAHSLNDQSIFKRLQAAAQVKGFGPLIIAFDDIHPYGEARKFARCLALLVDEAKKYGIKLLFTCQTDVLRNMRPFSQVRDADIFQPDREQQAEEDSSSNVPVSHELQDFNDDELQQAVSSRVEARRSDEFVSRLRDPAWGAFRNPYTLNAYLSQVPDASHGELDRLPKYNLGSLLDARIDKFVEMAADLAGIETQTVSEVLSDIAAKARALPQTERNRIAFLQKVERDQGSVGCRVLQALEDLGVVSFSGGVRITDTRLGAHLLARHLRSDLESLQQHLQVETDHDVVVQLCGLVADPVAFATDLVAGERRWIPAVAEGLANADSSEFRIYAALLAFTRLESDGWTAADSLGRFAIRCKAAWKDLVNRFLGHNDDDRHIAGRALWRIGAISVRHTVGVIRLCFKLQKKLPFDRKARASARRRLGDALRTAGAINSKFGASCVLKILKSVEAVVFDVVARGTCDETIAMELCDPLISQFVRIRALALSFADPSGLNEILHDLTNVDSVKRSRAINGIQLLSSVSPDQVQCRLLDAIRTETNPMLLAKLAWLSMRVAQKDPLTTVKSLAANTSDYWCNYGSAAPVLALLEKVGHQCPVLTASLLPVWEDRSDAFRFLIREFELLTRFACGEKIRRACEEPPATCDAKDMLYVLRAELAQRLISVSQELGISDSPEIWRTELDGGGMFFWADFSAWLVRHQHTVLPHVDAAELISTIVAAAQTARSSPADVLDRWGTQLRFRLVVDCLDVLVQIIALSTEPEATVAELPDDWERLYVSRKLMQQGVTTPGLIDLALVECERRRKSASAQASHERNECLIILEGVVPDRVPRFHEERDSLTWFFTGGRSAGGRLTTKIDSAVENAIDLLEDSIAHPSDMISLLEWNAQATHWSTVLLSHAYSRMFRPRPILTREAKAICKAMILGLDSLPANENVCEHRSIYLAILQRLEGTSVSIPRPRVDPNPIVQSHHVAAEALMHPLGRASEGDISRFLFDDRSWWESDNYRWLEDGRVEHGFGVSYHILVFFPAVRLALCALGQDCGWDDPGFTWSRERNAATVLSQEVNFDLRPPSHFAERWRDRMSQAIRDYPQQDVLIATYGQLLLTTGDLSGAERALNEALALPLCKGPLKGHVLYNLACVCARTGRGEECQAHLRTASEHYDVNVDWMKEDPDLEAVRNLPWFEAFLTARPKSEKQG